MTNEIHPLTAPSPKAGLIYDGSDFCVPLGDTDGRQIVRGEDQLFSYLGPYLDREFDLDAAAGMNTLVGTAVPAGEVWVVTYASCFDDTNAFTRHIMQVRSGLANYDITQGTGAAQQVSVDWGGHVYLREGAFMRVLMFGVTAGDAIYVHFFGHKMTLEV